MMIRPSHFGFNPMTAESNAFQMADPGDSPEKISMLARREFDTSIDNLIKANIDVIPFEDEDNKILPDSVFPNNWISFHDDGTVVLYPMMAENRRLERRTDILLQLQEKGFSINRILDYTSQELDARYLEGTGSVVFDHVNRIAFANHSPRTDSSVFKKLCSDLNYRDLLFNAVDPSGLDIYHTNVLMCIGTQFVVICLEAIHNDAQRRELLNASEQTGHEVIEISYGQLSSFVGNMLEVRKKDGDNAIIMSESAYNSLDAKQRSLLSGFGDLIVLTIPVIEKYGGGSARCMIAGIHLPKINA